MDICLSPARAAASRRNGAKSRGPKTAEGKARSGQNALKHGFRAQKHMVLPGEDGAEFAALEAALIEELAPEGALAELWRALRTLKTLQAERQEARPQPTVARARLLPEPHETPIEPEARKNPGETASVAARGEVVAIVPPALPEEPPAHGRKPIEPEARGNPGEIAPAPAAAAGEGRPHGELGAQVTQKCVTIRHSCAIHASPPANSFDAALRHGPAARSRGRCR